MRTQPRLHVRQRGRGWVYVIERGRYPPGHAKAGQRWREWSRQFPTEGDAQMAGAARLVEIGRGISTTPTRDTLGEWLARWQAGRHDVEPSTLRRQDGYLAWIIPTLGQVRLADLTPAMVRDWHARLLAEGKARSSVAIAHSILSHALKDAVRLDMVGRNVAALVSPPRRGRSEAAYWTQEEAARFLALDWRPDQAALFRLLLTTGLRIGEALALRWEEIDLDLAQLRVRATLAERRDTGTLYRKPYGKTLAAMRTVDLSSELLVALRRLATWQKGERLRAGPLWQEQGLVFTNQRGRWVHPTTVRHWLRQGIRATGTTPETRVRSITPHGFRHTYATLTLMAGIPVSVVSEQLGHANVSITLNVYGHVIPGMGRAAADLMGTLFPDAEAETG